VIPRHPLSPFASKIGPGAWELVARYSQLKFSSDDPVDFFDGNINNGITGGGRTAENGAESLTAGVNWYLNSRVRAMLNWNEYWYDNGRGTPYSCRQSTCGAGNLMGRDKTSWEILTRLQLWF
jgi:phosphate-selective porin OprO/OprP